MLTEPLFIILTAALALAAENQVKLEDLERDNLNSKQQQQHQQQQVKPTQPASVPPYIGHVDVPDHQHLNYLAQQQILQQHLQAYQPQAHFQAPLTAGNIALYPASFLTGNHLAIAPDVAYVVPQQPGIPTFHQPLYVQQGGLQFVHALPYSNHQAPPQPLPQHQRPPVPAESSPQPQHSLRGPQPAYHTPQQAYNPVPKELQSYTTIPDAVYQGKEPAFLYDQQPSVSLTHDGLNSHNALYQQPQPQRPVLSSGVKSADTFPPKALPNGGSFLTRNNFLNPPRHFPGPSISYSTYRQGSGAF